MSIHSKTLGELFNLQLGKTPSRHNTKYWENGNNKWASITDLSKSKKYISSTSEKITDIGVTENSIPIVPSNTLIMSFKLSIGKTAITTEPMYTNEAIIAFLPKSKNEIDINYLYYRLPAINWSKYTNKAVKGDTLNKTKISAYLFEYPPLSEQKRIVEILDNVFAKLDDVKLILEKQILNVEELFKSELNSYFKLNCDTWVQNSLKEITTKIGSGATPKGGKKSYKSSGISFIRSQNIYDNGFREDNLAFIDETQASKLNNVTICKNDILINITGASIARCCIVPSEYIPARVNQHVSIIRLKNDVLYPELLRYLLISPEYKHQLLGIGEEGGTTRQALTKADLEKLVIKYPQDLNEQQRIISEIKKMEKNSLQLINIYSKKLLIIEELRKSILDVAFRGVLLK